MSLTEQQRTAILTDVAGSIYDGAISPAGWQDALDKLSALLPSVAFTIYSHDLRAGNSLGLLSAGFDPTFLKPYLEYYASLNVFAPGFVNSPLGTVLMSDDLVDRETLLRTEYYNDWMRPQANQIGGVGSLLFNEDGRYLAWSSNYVEREEDELRDTLREVTELLIPHLNRAFLLTRLLAHAAQSDSVQSMLAAMPDPAFLLDTQNRLVIANEAGQTFADRNSYLRIQSNRKLHFTDPAAQLDFKIRMRGLGDSARAPRTGPFLAADGEGGRASVLVAPFAPERNDVLGFMRELFPARPVAIMVVRPARSDIALRLRTKAGFTRAEAEIAQLLMKGRSVNEIADRRQVSRETLRHQIKHIHAKLNVSRRGELISTLHRLTKPDDC